MKKFISSLSAFAFSNVSCTTADIQQLSDDKGDPCGIVDILPTVTLFLDTEGNISFVNKRLIKLTGYDEISLPGRKWFKTLIPEESRSDVRDLWERLLSLDISSVEDFKMQIRTRDGKELYMVWNAISLSDDNGDFQGLLVSGEDITELELSRKEIEESELLFRKAVEYSSLSLLILNADHEPVYMNHKFTETFGYTLEDLPSMEELWKFACPDQEYQQKAFCLWDPDGRSEDDGSTVHSNEWKIPCKDGSVKDIELNSTKITSDRIIIILKDITEAKSAEKALLLDELRLEALLELNQLTDSTVDDVLNFALEKAVELTESQIGYVGFVNEEDSVVEMYAWSKGSMELCFIEDIRTVYQIDQTGLWGEPIRQRIAVITNDYATTSNFKKGVPEGHIDIHRHLGIPTLDNDKVVMVAGVGNKAADYDSSDVRQMTLLMEGTWKLIQGKQNEAKIKAYAEQLSRTNKELESLDRMKDEFMANITHELKTPLIPIKGYSELLFEGHLGTLDDDQKRSMGVILQNASRLEKLIDSLLYMQNIHSGNIQYHLDSIDITSLLDKVINELNSFKGEDSPALHKEYYSSLPYICGNSTYLEQVFSHILENAFKFTSSDGLVTVISSMEGKMIKVTVKDTGIGISGEEMPHIFKRFYQADGSLTRRYGGNGLGLYLCKSIVEAHGGSIWAESEEGKGTELHVLLPVIEDA